ncbi:MAG TPA: acyl-CoA dehydrogenase [Polyangiaceae bacterium]|nr:acyl-CoA dehydrogenase [Polyangiaceae bacterium]
MLEQHYQPNLRDTFFQLFEVLEIQKTSLGHEPFASMDEATAREALKQNEKLCLSELQNSFAESDRTPLEFDGKGNVTLPACLAKAYHAFYEAGAHLFSLPESMGGMGATPSMSWAGFELVAGANAPLAFYLFGTFAARTIQRHGTEDQKRRFVDGLVNKRWGGSMVLTEPEAGSDVGAGRTKARQIDGNLYEIEGTKRFITNGDFDVPENLVHLVLARPEGAGVGTKGLSLFIVPKFWVNEDGSLGERNGAYVTKVEKKMGIKASATCEMVFGDGKPARGLLVGGVHDGIRQMFHVIEQARMAVGVKSMSTLSTAYRNALAYTKERTQGPDLLVAADKAAPRVKIIRHPDVRRMLMSQKAHAEGMRALCLYTAWVQDQVEIKGGHGNKEADALDKLNDMLLPLVKGYCSEKAYEQLSLSLQTYGGSGYIQDFPIEQYVRDQKIDTLYEGTTHIQALDLFFRKIAKDGGATLTAQLEQIAALAKSDAGGDALAEDRAALLRALGDLQGIFGAMMGKIGESLYHAGLQGNRILFALAEVVIGWLWLRQGIAAIAGKANNPADASFYDGKLAALRWWTKNVLPGITLTKKLVEASSLELMSLSDDAF